MRFYNPLGLLALLAIPVIILIYIIKNRYVEQVIASTYIWELSEKFLKRRLPINKLVGFLSLILQLLMVVFIAFGMARPVFTVKNSAYDYVFVLDASASMNMEQNGKSRFDRAKSEIAEIIGDSVKGSSYTLILANGHATEVYSDLTDKARAITLLNDSTSSYLADDLVESIKVAQEIFNENNSCRIYLLTDRNIEQYENVEYIQIRGEEENYSLVSYEISVDKDYTYVAGEVISHVSDAKIELSLYFDDVKVATTEVDITAEGEPTSYTLQTTQKNYNVIKVVIETEDALKADNEIIVYSVTQDNKFSALLVSKDPFFLEKMLLTYSGCSVETVSPDNYATVTKEYDLYVYDSFTPEWLPTYGAVWFFNPTSSVENSGFALKEKVTEELDVKLEYSTSTHTTVTKLLNGLFKDTVSVKVYQNVNLKKSFNVLAYTSSMPAIFAGVNNNGNRQVVFNFDVHDSDIAVSHDFVILTHNLIKYLFPTDLEENLYYAGDSLGVNVLSSCKSIKLSMPSGKSVWLDTSSEIASYDLTEVGTYMVTVTTTTNEKAYNIFVSVPELERNPVSSTPSFIVAGTPSGEKRDSYFDDVWYLFMLVAVFAVADWMVYCYEQYKLR